MRKFFRIVFENSNSYKAGSRRQETGALARADEKKTYTGGEGGSGPRAMGRVLRLFKLLARQQRSGMSLTDLSTALDVPKSTLLGTLKPLAADGFLLAEGALYRLGPAAFRLAGTILTAWSAPEL